LALNIAPYPLFVEIVYRGPTAINTCTTFLAGALVMVANGFPVQCGGVWERVGPIDLAQSGIPLGSFYHIQVVAFVGSGVLSCLTVTSTGQVETTITESTWSAIKQLYGR
jgi:hypothetical protein